MSKAEDVLRALAGDVGVGAATTVPSLPASPSTGDATLDQFLSALKQTVETWSGIRGDSLDATVTWRDLINKQFAKIDVSSGNPANQLAGIKPTAAASEIDYTPPAAPTGLVATGALSTIILDWDAPTYKNHAYTEIWRSSTNNIGTAEKIGMSPGAVYADSVGGGFTYYYWVRFVSLANVVGAYNLTDGTAGTTSSNPDYVLDLLSGQITESELATGLNTRINLIDAPATTNGSVAARIKAETDARVTAIQNEATARAAAILDEANARQTAVTAEATARQDADNALSQSIVTLTASVDSNNTNLLAAIQDEATARASADSAEATNRNTLATQLRGNYTGGNISEVSSGLIYAERMARSTADGTLASNIESVSANLTSNVGTLNAAITAEQTARVNADSALASDISSLQSTVSTNNATVTASIQSEAQARTSADEALGTRIDTVEATVTNNNATLNAAVQSEATARTNADSALANSITTLTSTVNSNNATLSSAIQNEQTARTDADTALTNSITTLQSTVTANNQTLTAAVQQEASTRANADGALEAQYTVKLDVNGYVSGFGLASTLNNATPFSNFIFKADQFAFGAPGLTTAYPFVIQATATTVNGVAVPAGVYIDAAYIKNGTLTNAKIGNAAIDSAKIADAAIVTAKIGDAQITTAKIADAQITNAKINDLSAEKINAGTISADRIGANSITAGKIDTRGLTIKDDAGNVVFAAASGLDWSLINGSNKPADGATKNTIYRQATAPTSGMSVNDVWFDTTNSATYYYSGSAWVLAGDKTASNTAAAIANQGAFATLNQIDSTNVSTYIANAAIQNAQIGNVIQSNIYISGQSGWKIDKTGNMELNSAVFRGSLDVKSASSGARMQVTNSQIAVYDAGGVLRVLIGNLG